VGDNNYAYMVVANNLSSFPISNVYVNSAARMTLATATQAMLCNGNS